jgi:hypothetical protein
LIEVWIPIAICLYFHVSPAPKDSLNVCCPVNFEAAQQCRTRK